MASDPVAPLVHRYDVAMLDLDGVVYIGGDGVPGAADHLARAREAGQRLAFVTNNASRPPQQVAELLTRLGVPAEVHDVVTSAQAAASLLEERCGAGSRVAVLGGPGLHESVSQAGLVPVGVDEEADAVVSGYGPDVRWAEIMRAATRIAGGLWWVTTNVDGTIPTPDGIAPGNGVLVEMMRGFTKVDPVVAGKPSRPLLDETIRRLDARRPLMVGDRLDTDIAGAVEVGVDSLLVMTGVTDLDVLVAAPAASRPTYVAADLSGLLVPPVQVGHDDGTWTAEGWRLRGDGEDWDVEGQGSSHAWWSLVAAFAWAWADEHGETVETRGVRPPGATEASE